MPSRGKYIAFFVINWCMGILWGLLSLGAFITMNKAINAGDVEQAQKSAKKVQTIFIIGLIVTIVICVVCIIIGAVSATKMR